MKVVMGLMTVIALSALIAGWVRHDEGQDVGSLTTQVHLTQKASS